MHATVVYRRNQRIRYCRLIRQRGMPRRGHQAQAIVDECPDRLVDRPLYLVGHGPFMKKSFFVTGCEDDLVDCLAETTSDFTDK